MTKTPSRVRVSLGLNPRFERTLYWSPYKRISQAVTLMQANAEGVFVCEGAGVDSIRLFDHDGIYVRTVYPFPADKWGQVKDLECHDFVQAGRLPLKQSLYQQTLLTCGNNCSDGDQLGRPAMPPAAWRSAATGSPWPTCGSIAFLPTARAADNRFPAARPARPSPGLRSATPTTTWSTWPHQRRISPDGKWLYLAGYFFRQAFNFDTLHGVMRMPLDGGLEDAQPFLGKFSCERDMRRARGPSPASSPTHRPSTATSRDASTSRTS